MKYEEILKKMVKTGFTFKYVLEEDIYKLKLNTEEEKEFRKILADKDIRIFTRDEKSRSPLVRDLNYGELESVNYGHTDKPRFSEIEYKDGEVISEDFEELDFRIETELIPNALHTVVRSGRGYAINTISLNAITRMRLSDEEVKHVLEYLKELDIVVRGTSHDLDDLDNYESVATYHYSHLPKALTSEENDALIRQYKATKDHQILNKIIEGNMRLVIPIAARVFKKNRLVQMDDLVAAGYEKLKTIIDNFDVSLGYSFSTYATPCLEGYMKQEIRENYVFSASIGELLNRYRKAKEALDKQMPNYTDSDIAEILDVPISTIDELKKADQASQENLEYANNIISSADDVEKEAFYSLLRETLEECMSTLDERTQLVLKLRFGLDGSEPMTLEQAGKVMGVTGARVRQIELRGLRKLRHPSRSRLLNSYIEVNYGREDSLTDGYTEEEMDDYNYDDEFVNPIEEMNSRRNY